MYVIFRSLIVGLMLVLIGCSPSPPIREFAIPDLLIGSDSFPSNWVLYKDVSKQLSNEGQEEGFYITYHTDAPVIVRAGENVYRYASQSKAEKHFDRFEREYLNDNSVYSLSPWTMPAELPFVSTVADQSRFACADNSFGYESTICIFLGQYDEFLVFSTATIAAEGVSYMEFSELRVILQAIDQAMADHGLGQE